MSQPVSIPPCPHCSAPNARYLAFTSDLNKADTFQCTACGQVWVEPHSDKKETEVA